MASRFHRDRKVYPSRAACRTLWGVSYPRGRDLNHRAMVGRTAGSRALWRDAFHLPARRAPARQVGHVRFGSGDRHLFWTDLEAHGGVRRQKRSQSPTLRRVRCLLAGRAELAYAAPTPANDAIWRRPNEAGGLAPLRRSHEKSMAAVVTPTRVSISAMDSC